MPKHIQKFTQKNITIKLVILLITGLTVLISKNHICNIQPNNSVVDSVEKNALPTNNLKKNEYSSLIQSEDYSQKLSTQPSDAETKARVFQTYSQLPLLFEPSNHQVQNDEVNFISRGQGYKSVSSPSKATLALRQITISKNKFEKNRESREFRRFRSKRSPEGGSTEKQKYRKTVVEMQMVGSNSQATSSGIEEIPGRSNYFIGSNPDKWQTDITNYKRVKFENVYTGINLEYYGNQRQLEYDFIVQPNADPSQIRLSFNGVNKITVDQQSGELILKTALGEVRQKNPFVYQTDFK